MTFSKRLVYPVSTPRVPFLLCCLIVCSFSGLARQAYLSYQSEIIYRQCVGLMSFGLSIHLPPSRAIATAKAKCAL